MEIDVAELEAPAVDQQRMESVERKGLDHPDTICDALTEQLSMALSRFYLERFALILHHNVDKALLFAGASEPRFGGGRVLEPLQLFLAGLATLEAEGQEVPIEEIAVMQLRCVEDGALAELATQAREIAGDHLERIGSLWRDLLEGRVAIDRWPLRRER
jgi:S-adenosylmethionine synthetase